MFPWRAWSRVSQFGQKHPVIFGSVYSALKTSSSDIFAQKIFEDRDTIDWRRNCVFLTFGLTWLGGVQYFIYVKLFTQRLFPDAAKFVTKSIREKIADRAGQKAVVMQVGLDQFIHHPFMLFPVFYQVKAFIEGATPQAGFRNFCKHGWDDLKLCWAIWIPAFTINFSFSPPWLRVPFVATVSFFATIILSKRRGAPMDG